MWFYKGSNNLPQWLLPKKKIQIFRVHNLNMDPRMKNDFLKTIKKKLLSRSAIGFQLSFEWPRFILSQPIHTLIVVQ
jgi:hypothetical protein